MTKSLKNLSLIGGVWGWRSVRWPSPRGRDPVPRLLEAHHGQLRGAGRGNRQENHRQPALERDDCHVGDRRKPVKGEPITVTGEVIDLSCYLQVGKHGDKHKACGQKCATSGQPIGILLEDGSIYTLMDEEHDPRRDGMTELRKQLIENMANVVKVNGTLTEVEGQKSIYVQGSVKK